MAPRAHQDDDEASDDLAEDVGRSRRRKHRPIPKRPEDRGRSGVPLHDGKVVRIDARQCRVDLADKTIACRMRGSLFLDRGNDSRPLAVGDDVRVAIDNVGGAAVAAVLPRRNVLARPHADRKHRQVIAANLDQAVIVSSCSDPPINLRLVDRVIVACESQGFGAVLVVNKADLLEDVRLLEEVAAVYRAMGYDVLLTSVLRGSGIDAVRERLRGKTSVFVGMSGVGKSTLLNAVQPGLGLISGSVSAATGKGKHTTTYTTLRMLDVGGFVVDTPGVREFGMYEIAADAVGRFFRDFAPFRDHCVMRSCVHTHEDGCAVEAAVERGEIAAWRYDSYLRILDKLSAGRHGL